MNLSYALRVPDRAVVAIVGGGGKTSALYRLAAELAEPGHGRVLLMTTAKMLLPQEGQADGLFVHRVYGAIAERHEATLPYLRRIAIAPDVLETAEGWKLDSVPPDWPRRLAGLPRVANVLVEADGSRHLPLKAPAAYEPPIPPDADIVLVVVGLVALGQPLDKAHVHRPEQVAALTGQALGAPVTVDVVAGVLTHPEGGLKNVPPGARVVALLNGVTDDTLETARSLARRILANDRYEAVLIGAVQDSDPVRERHVRLGAVVLAAGGARRFGAAKQTLPWQGTTLVGHALSLAHASGAAETVLVTGAHQAEVEEAGEAWRGQHPSSPPFTTVHNADWADGLSASVRTGLGALPERVQAALFLLADQPAVTPDLVQALVQRYVETGAPLVVPTFGGRRGNPTLFDRALWPELAQVTGDQGGRALIEQYRDRVEFVEVGEAGALDVDTPEDYRRLVGEA